MALPLLNGLEVVGLRVLVSAPGQLFPWVFLCSLSNF